MAKPKNRIVNTKFWTDTYILDELNPIDKLLFLYLLTNPYTDISGVYELPLKVMAVETGVDRDNILNVILPRFERDGKILYRNGWVAIKNFQKHQSINPKVMAGMKEGLNRAPEELKSFMEDSLSIDYDSLRHIKTKIDIEIDTKKDIEKDIEKEIIVATKSPTPKEEVEDFLKGGKTYSEIYSVLIENIPEEVVDRELQNFISYWTEPNKSGTRQRWEQQSTFEIKRRLRTWFMNIKQFNKNKGKQII